MGIHENYDFAEENQIFYDQLHSEIRNSQEDLHVVSVLKEKKLPTEQLLNMKQQTIFWGEDMVLHLAPGQQNKPDAEELSFPAIYYG